MMAVGRKKTPPNQVKETESAPAIKYYRIIVRCRQRRQQSSYVLVLNLVVVLLSPPSPKTQQRIVSTLCLTSASSIHCSMTTPPRPLVHSVLPTPNPPNAPRVVIHSPRQHIMRLKMCSVAKNRILARHTPADGTSNEKTKSISAMNTVSELVG